MDALTTLAMDVYVTSEQREDRWAFYVHEFGFTVYGKSEQEGDEVVDAAVTTLLNSFGGDDDELRRFLDARGVRHSFTAMSTGVTSPRASGGRTTHREIEVTLAAAI